jgi:ABC-type transport system involved in multi-copper enzyme maturation permease subunit
MGLALCVTLLAITSARLLHPPDVGSEGKEVVDLEQEAQEAIGLVIQRDQFPDRLFAPAKRDDLIEDGINPVYDKEIRSEIFSQGTLMLRLVIQVSMVLAIPLMAVCLYIWAEYAAWYISYVLLFNMLVGPVFSAGSITSERERQTLDLLLTTTITPWQILWGKLIAGLRVSSVLTMFLLWPVLLACIMVPTYWENLGAVAAYLTIVLLTCLSTAMLALFASVIFRKTATSLMTAYLVVIVLFCLPLAVSFFLVEFFPAHPATAHVEWLGVTSPFAATFAVPIDMELVQSALDREVPGNWLLVAAHVAFTLVMNGGLLLSMIWLFNVRWRVSS